MEVTWIQWHRLVFLVLVLYALSNRIGLDLGARCALAAQDDEQDSKHSPLNPPAIIAFGDSILDTGNNNRWITLSKSNFPPYGRDFIDGKATGRFTNGRLVIDFIADKLGLPYVPPYLRDRANSDFQATTDYTKGINFASGGAGWLSTTSALFGSIPIATQIKYLDTYIDYLKDALGENAATEFLAESIIMISLGSNDYFGYINRATQLAFSDEYADQLLAIAEETIQQLHKRGGRRIAAIGLGPLGCVPFVRQVLGKNSPAECVQSMNDHVSIYNSKLDALVNRLRETLDDATLVHVTINDFFLQLYQQDHDEQGLGLTQVVEPCCGGEHLSSADQDIDPSVLEWLACTPLTPVCADASSYMFWDILYPTEATYKLLSDYVFPVFISQLIPGYL